MENNNQLDLLMQKMALYLLRNGIFMTNEECKEMEKIYYHLLDPLLVKKVTQNYMLN